MTVENGALESAKLGWHVSTTAAAARTTGDLVIGTSGVIEIDQRPTGLESGTNGRLDPGFEGVFWPESSGIPGGAPGLEIWHFAGCLRGRHEPAIRLTEAIEVQRLWLAMEHAAATGTDVDLATFGCSRPDRAAVQAMGGTRQS